MWRPYAGASIQLYHDAEYMEDGADLELCVPTKKDVSHPDVTVKKLPGVRALCTTPVKTDYRKQEKGLYQPELWNIFHTASV